MALHLVVNCIRKLFILLVITTLIICLIYLKVTRNIQESTKVINTNVTNSINLNTILPTSNVIILKLPRSGSSWFTELLNKLVIYMYFYIDNILEIVDSYSC